MLSLSIRVNTYLAYINMPNFVEQIEVGDVICEIETDKATLEFENLEEG